MPAFDALVSLGWNDHWSARFAEIELPGAMPARVIRHDSSQVLVAGVDGLASLPLQTDGVNPTVGDWVVVTEETVVAILPRRSFLRRRDAGGDVEQALAANVDVVVVVCGLDRPMKARRVQRFVTMAHDAGAEPVIVLTKADLADASDAMDELDVEVPGVSVIPVSSTNGNGIESVWRAIRGRTVVLVGESGAGKSTMLNALAGDDIAATGDVRAGDSKGRHTTTSRHLHVLPGDSVVIDSPGIRAVGVWADAEAVAATFPEIGALAARCRFSDCGHRVEPGCAVLAAVEEGELTGPRYRAWAAMERESQAAARSEHERRRLGRQFGRVAKAAQRRKGRR